MSEQYDHKKIEKKWQRKWEETRAFTASDDSEKQKSYLLVEFPYPSGEGLHTGHVRSYAAMDAVVRKRRMQGLNVLYPIGWDAFGLPTENYAIKTGVQPKLVTKQNTDTFRRQLKSLGLSFDWSREVNTTDPNYYKWTQWIFLQFFKKGLAYKAKTTINWCPKDKIGLANEEVVDGCCERCGTPVEKREKEQWMLAITKYAQRLYDDLETVDYIERAKIQQRNWIGPSEGAEIDFELTFKKNPADNERRGSDGKKAHITIFTTRADTLFGATFLVLAPEHLWVALATDDDHDVLENKDEVKTYIEAAKKKTELERTVEGKKKTGVKLEGVGAINPATGEEIPLFVADYVFGSYGTGAIMAVPAHDKRDSIFAGSFNLPVKNVLHPNLSTRRDSLIQMDDNASHRNSPELLEEILSGKQIWVYDGKLRNSGKFNGLESEEAKKKIIEFVKGRSVTTFKLRDWVFSRQRYWGEPIPMIHCKTCGWQPVPESDLPILLPEVEKFQPTDNGESPLANFKEFVETLCPHCKGPAKRETDVMPNWAGSSWYYLRYTDAHNDREFASMDKLNLWTPVDWYNGGMEHTVLHLLYSRFWHKFLFDEGLVPTSEPYAKRTSHGLILSGDGTKMSKSKGNVVNPDELVENVGADSLRLYEMFMGPFEQAIAWNTNGVIGMRRFLERIWSMYERVAEVPMEPVIESLMHQTIQKVGEDIESLKMNTATSTLMIFSNHLHALEKIPRSGYTTFLQLLTPFAPHITSELAEKLGLEWGSHPPIWPQFDPIKVRAQLANIAVQINSRVRVILKLPPDLLEAEALAKARSDSSVAKWLSKGDEIKAVYVPGKVINFVIKPHSAI